MPDLKTHEQECIRQLGQPYTTSVDEFMKVVGPTHRAIRHNPKGVEYVRRVWGDGAAKAAEIHIAQDESEFANAHIIDV